MARPPWPATHIVEPRAAGVLEYAEDTGSLNLNAADLRELIDLPGIGPVLAERILEYRELVGLFTDERELLRINGIGEITGAKLYPLVYVGE